MKSSYHYNVTCIFALNSGSVIPNLIRDPVLFLDSGLRRNDGSAMVSFSSFPGSTLGTSSSYGSSHFFCSWAYNESRRRWLEPQEIPFQGWSLGTKREKALERRGKKPWNEEGKALERRGRERVEQTFAVVLKCIL